MPLDLALNYTEEYGDAADPSLRLALSARRTAVSTAVGAGGALLGAAGVALICGVTAGAGCVVLGIAAAAGGGWVGSELGAGLVDSGALDRVVIGPAPGQCPSFDDYCGGMGDDWWDENWGPGA